MGAIVTKDSTNNDVTYDGTNEKSYTLTSYNEHISSFEMDTSEIDNILYKMNELWRCDIFVKCKSNVKRAIYLHESIDEHSWATVLCKAINGMRKVKHYADMLPYDQAGYFIDMEIAFVEAKEYIVGDSIVPIETMYDHKHVIASFIRERLDREFELYMAR